MFLCFFIDIEKEFHVIVEICLKPNKILQTNMNIVHLKTSYRHLRGKQLTLHKRRSSKEETSRIIIMSKFVPLITFSQIFSLK